MIKTRCHRHRVLAALRFGASRTMPGRRRAVRLLTCALSALVLILAGGPARAAPPVTGGHAAAPTAATPTTGTSTPATPTAATPTSGAGEEASTRFKRGLQLFDEGDYTLALVEFERAYQLAPNYRALYNIALVDIQLGRYADAARTFEAYLHDGGTAIAPARRAEVANSLAGLKLRTATVEIATNVPSAEVTLDGKPLEASRLHVPIVIDAGEHTLRATAPGFQSANKTVTLAGADRASVRLELAAIPQSHSPSEAPVRARGPFWPGFVVTGGLAAGAIVSAAVMLDAQSHLGQLKNDPGSDRGQRESAATRVNSAALAADILTGLALVAGGISVYLSLGPERSPKPASVAVSPQRVVFTVPF